MIESTTVDATPLEEALVTLARQARAEPRALSPESLGPLQRLVGDGALVRAGAGPVPLHHTDRRCSRYHSGCQKNLGTVIYYVLKSSDVFTGVYPHVVY